MNRSMVTGIVVGVSIAVAGAVMANYVMREDTATGGEAVEIAATDTTAAPTAAAGTSATAPTPAPAAPASAPEPVAAAPAPSAPQEECWDEEVTHTKDAVDDKHIAGTVIGAIVGGAIGHQFGGGSGKTLATAAGAAAGGYGGNRAQKAIQDKSNTYTTIERRCRPVQQ
jgi:uncharacterized protein YcfJ